MLTSDGKHYVLNGQKMWITNGGFADLFTIFAKVDGEKFTAFLVERGMGVVSGSDEKKLGLDGSSTTALMLDDVKVPVENVLGTIGEGHKVAFNILNLGRVKLGARNIACARIRRSPTPRLREGAPAVRQGDRRVRAHQAQARRDGDPHATSATRWSIARSATSTARSRPSIPATARRVLKTIEGFAVECSVNKVFTSEALAYVVDEAVQVFGGNGYSREFPAERAYRDARITRIYEGHQRDQPPADPDAPLQGRASCRPPRPTAAAGTGALAAERSGCSGSSRRWRWRC